MPDISNRNFAERGSTLSLSAAFYSSDALTTPYSYGSVAIYRGDTLLETIASGSVTVTSPGILTVEYDLAADATLGTYEDTWSDIVMVSGNAAVDYTFEFYAVASNVPVAYSSDECTIYQYLRDDEGKPLANAVGYAHVSNRPYTIDDASSILDATNVQKALSDTSGRISWKMPIASEVVVDIPDADIYVKKTVPDQPSVQITSMTDTED